MKKITSPLIISMLLVLFSNNSYGQCQNVILVTDPPGAEVCDGLSIEIMADWDIGSPCNPVTYEWMIYMGATIGTTMVNSFTVTPVFPSTTYVVVLKDSDGMVIGTSAPLEIMVNPNPQVTITANPNTDVCDGTQVTLTANGAGGTGALSYMWSENSSGPVIMPIVTITNNSFSVTVTDSKGCEGTDDHEINVSSNPIACISNPDPVACVNMSINFDACCSSGSGLTYSWSPTQWLSDPDDCNPVWTPTGEVTNFEYTVTVTNSSGCTATASLFADAVTTPTAIINGETETCLGENIILSGGNTGMCMWAPSSFFSNSNGCQTEFTSTSAGVGTHDISLTVTLGGCSSSTTQSITVHPLPMIDAQGDEACLGESDIISACNSMGNTPLSFSWTPTNGLTNPNACETEVNQTVAGTYPYTVTAQDVNSCTATQVVNAIFKSLPNASINPNNQTICEGGNATLTASGGVTYLWSTGETTPIITVSPTSSQPYSVTVVGGNGCENDASAQVNVVPDPTVTIVGTDVICAGDSFTLIADPKNGTGIPSYSWERSTDGGSTWSTPIGAAVNLSETITATTQYRVKLTYNGAGCNQAVSPVKTVTVVPTPTPIIEGTLEICKNQQAIYFVSNPVSQTSSTFEWTLPGGASILDTTDFGSYVFVHWNDDVMNQSTFQISVKETIGFGGQCFGTNSINVTVGSGTARDPAPIIHTTVNNILILKDPDAQCYQWGYLDPANGEFAEIPGENFQAYAAGVAYADRIYWVKTWDGDCSDPDPACATFSFRTETVDEPIEPAVHKFLLYPNPNNGDFQLEINQLPDKEYTLLVADVLGRVIEKRVVATPDGEMDENIKLDEMVSSGLFTLVLLNKSGIYKTRKFVVH